MPRARAAGVVLAVALGARLLPILLADRMAADIVRYHKIASYVLDVDWNPYTSHGLYPYPPVWIGFEVAAEWLARHTGLPFPVLVKLPVLAADLAIVWVLQAWPGAGLRAAWLYALHPVSLLITGFHGQFDSLMLLALLLTILWRDAGRLDASALALAAAIGLKTLPVLLLPLFLIGLAPARVRLRYALLASAPVGLSLVPFALDDAQGVVRELGAYGGVADFGWIAFDRGLLWLRSGVLPRSEARFWGLLVPTAKVLFLLVYAWLVFALRARRLRLTTSDAALAVLLAFVTLYGAISAQYLVWVVPFAALRPDRYFVAYSAAATAALLGFYAFLQPGVLAIPAWATASRVAGELWLAGLSALLFAGAFWLDALLRLGRQAAQDAGSPQG